MNYDNCIFQYTIVLHHGEMIHRHGNTVAEAKRKAREYISELRMREYVEIISTKIDKVVITSDGYQVEKYSP